jgi:hypothetical protein
MKNYVFLTGLADFYTHFHTQTYTQDILTEIFCILSLPFLCLNWLILAVYPGRDLNPHIRNEYRILSPACLPIPPPGQKTSLKVKK